MASRRDVRLLWGCAVTNPLADLGDAVVDAFRPILEPMLRYIDRALWAWETRRCECHWHEPYGRVVMAGCPEHD